MNEKLVDAAIGGTTTRDPRIDNDIYLSRQRHILLDMHTPDWDPKFLSKYDPRKFVELCADAGADAVMIYTNSSAGECFWPTKSGRVHQNLADRDIVKESIEELHTRGIAACALYSAIWNNWTYREFPEWQIVPSGPGGVYGPGSRMGVCCPNHPDYMDFMLQQTEELTDYEWDAFFFDMVLWPDVCVCDSCRARYRREDGAELPTHVDWCAPEWCQFQAARERWMLDCARQLHDRVKRSLAIPVFHNSAGIGYGWFSGFSPEMLLVSDVIGGDTADYWDRSAVPLFIQSTRHAMQLMKPISGLGGGVSQLRPLEEQKIHALMATTFGGQFMAIDAVEPDGSVNSGAYQQLSEVFAEIEPYQAYMGQKPMADVAVYWSFQANVSFGDNGKKLDEIHLVHGRQSAVGSAVHGVVTSLGEVHITATVITRADLDRLSEFKVLILPNVVRMDMEEIDAIRAYVDQGGRLYASGYTSVVTVDGTRHGDFLLGDVFGCSLVGEEDAAITFLRPATGEAAGWIDPIQYVPHGEPYARYSQPVTTLRVAASDDAEILATATLPYAGGRGTRDDFDWANLLASPPWEDTDSPALVRHQYGNGEAVYSTGDIENTWHSSATGAVGSSHGAARSLFAGIVRSLLRGEETFEATTHPDVIATVFHDTDRRQFRVCFLNRQPRFPTLPIPTTTFRLAAPTDATFSKLVRLPAGEPVEFTVDSSGSLTAEMTDLALFAMLEATYE